MKKITLLLCGLTLSVASYGQQILSHSTENVFQFGSIACANDPDQVPGSGDEATSDNIYYRTYTPSNFEFTDTFTIMGGQSFFTFTDIGGNGAIGGGTLRFFTSDDVFPAGNLTEIASQPFDLSTDDNGVLRQIMLDTPVDVDSNTEIIIAFDLPASDVSPNNIDNRVGGNDLGEDAPSYISSIACGINSPTTFSAINFPDNHLIIDLIGDGNVLSVGDNELSESITVFPNPTAGDLNINFSKNFDTTNINIININGQTVINTTVNGIGNRTIDTNSLATGVYFAQLSNDVGTTTIKFIKN